MPEIGQYDQYEAGTAGIFSSTKQGGRVYQIAGRYGIFRPYRPVRYGIDNLDLATHIYTKEINENNAKHLKEEEKKIKKSSRTFPLLLSQPPPKAKEKIPQI